MKWETMFAQVTEVDDDLAFKVIIYTEFWPYCFWAANRLLKEDVDRHPELYKENLDFLVEQIQAHMDTVLERTAAIQNRSDRK